MRYLAIIACLCFATTAQAAQSAQNANSVYGGMFGGFTLLPDLDFSQPGVSGEVESDAGYNFGGVLGYKWAFGFRAEGEISYRENDLDNFIGDLSALAFMANGWYDFYIGTPWIPYVGGGLGVARITLDSGAEDSDTVFAWQIGGGIGFEVSPGIVISADYRFLATEDAFFSKPGLIPTNLEYMSHNLMFGLRGHF